MRLQYDGVDKSVNLILERWENLQRERWVAIGEQFQKKEHWINCKLARNQRGGRTHEEGGGLEFVRTGDCKVLPA